MLADTNSNQKVDDIDGPTENYYHVSTYNIRVAIGTANFTDRS